MLSLYIFEIGTAIFEINANNHHLPLINIYQNAPHSLSSSSINPSCLMPPGTLTYRLTNRINQKKPPIVRTHPPTASPTESFPSPLPEQVQYSTSTALRSLGARTKKIKKFASVFISRRKFISIGLGKIGQGRQESTDEISGVSGDDEERLRVVGVLWHGD